MDTFLHLKEFLSSLPAVRRWPQMEALIHRTLQHRVNDWLLPRLGCEAVGGRAEWAIPAMAALVCAQMGIILVDDMLDSDPRGEYRRLGQPATANLAQALQAVALEAIGTSAGRDPQIVLAAIQTLNDMLAGVAHGQALDCQGAADEAGYWQIVRAKSSPFYGAALSLGGLAGRAPLTLVNQLGKWGGLYGEIIQIHDDLNDSMATPANPDWAIGRVSLPLLYAQSVSHPEQARFLKLRRAVPDPKALAEAQEILMRSGAFSYGIYQLRHRLAQARAMLAAMPLAHPAGLAALLDEQLKPVEVLLLKAKAKAQGKGCRRPRTAAAPAGPTGGR